MSAGTIAYRMSAPHIPPIVANATTTIKMIKGLLSSLMIDTLFLFVLVKGISYKDTHYFQYMTILFHKNTNLPVIEWF